MEVIYVAVFVAIKVANNLGCFMCVVSEMLVIFLELLDFCKTFILIYICLKDFLNGTSDPPDRAIICCSHFR